MILNLFKQTDDKVLSRTKASMYMSIIIGVVFLGFSVNTYLGIEHLISENEKIFSLTSRINGLEQNETEEVLNGVSTGILNSLAKQKVRIYDTLWWVLALLSFMSFLHAYDIHKLRKVVLKLKKTDA